MRYDEMLKVLERGVVSEEWLSKHAADEDTNGCDETREYNEAVETARRLVKKLGVAMRLIDLFRENNALYGKRVDTSKILALTLDIVELEEKLDSYET